MRWSTTSGQTVPMNNCGLISIAVMRRTRLSSHMAHSLEVRLQHAMESAINRYYIPEYKRLNLGLRDMDISVFSFHPFHE